MKLGILGTGMIVHDGLPMLKKQNIDKIVILGTEATREQTEELKEKYNLDGTFYDYDALLDSDVDTVYVALPNHLHYPFALKALQRGKNAIIEKPGTANAAELKKLKEVAEENNALVIEAMNVHYLPTFHQLKKDLELLGNIKIVNFNYSQYSSRYNAFKEGTILPAFDYHKAGGALMDINVYNVNTIMGLFGTPKSVNYFANVERGIDTSGILNLNYGSFQAVSIGAKDSASTGYCMIQGDKGVIVTHRSPNILDEYELTIYGQEPVKKTFNQTEHRMYYEFEEFVRIINERDFDKQREMIALSIEISQVMEAARKQNGIIFDQDNEEL